ncbi:MAG: hypothetical protein ACT443_13630, partial [Gemmatimonadota bacterium]
MSKLALISMLALLLSNMSKLNAQQRQRLARTDLEAHIDREVRIRHSSGYAAGILSGLVGDSLIISSHRAKQRPLAARFPIGRAARDPFTRSTQSARIPSGSTYGKTSCQRPLLRPMGRDDQRIAHQATEYPRRV